MLPELPDDIVKMIFVKKFIDEAKDDTRLGTRWTMRTYDGKLRCPRKPIYDRKSARLYTIIPQAQPRGTIDFLTHER